MGSPPVVVNVIFIVFIFRLRLALRVTNGNNVEWDDMVGKVEG